MLSKEKKGENWRTKGFPTRLLEQFFCPEGVPQTNYPNNSFGNTLNSLKTRVIIRVPSQWKRVNCVFVWCFFFVHLLVIWGTIFFICCLLQICREFWQKLEGQSRWRNSLRMLLELTGEQDQKVGFICSRSTLRSNSLQNPQFASLFCVKVVSALVLDFKPLFKTTTSAVLPQAHVVREKPKGLSRRDYEHHHAAFIQHMERHSTFLNVFLNVFDWKKCKTLTYISCQLITERLHFIGIFMAIAFLNLFDNLRWIYSLEVYVD